ncbi:MAG: universal stress protein [Chloroflexi bacterium]|nr:universal stress protein [Chloroflexota bacterium]
MTNPILVPNDGSAEAEYGLTVAILVARALDTPIRLFWSWERPAGLEEVVTASFATQIEKRELADRREHLQSLGERICGPAGVDWSVEVGIGEPEETIVARANAIDAEMIVMATHGRSGFKRWRLGSVADRVVRTSDRPTMLIHPQPDAAVPRAIRTVLVPLDGSERSEAALPAAIRLTEATAATLRLLRVAKLIAPMAAVDYGASYQDLDGAVAAAAAAYLDEVRKRLAVEPIEVSVISRDPRSGIIEEAHDVDLIVMASHGRGGMLRMALGSVTDTVIRGAGKPVLVVPVPDA